MIKFYFIDSTIIDNKIIELESYIDSCKKPQPSEEKTLSLLKDIKRKSISEVSLYYYIKILTIKQFKSALGVYNLFKIF